MSKMSTPCIGVCSTALGDNVCKGCKRRDYEVDQWNTYDEGKKEDIDDRLDDVLSKYMKQHFEIVDQHALEQFLLEDSRKNKILLHRSLYSALYDSLRAYKNNSDLSVMGVEQTRLESVTEALEAIDSSWYMESCARYNT